MKVNSKYYENFHPSFASTEREHHTNSNLENRIDEDEKLRNLSLRKLVNSKSNDGQQKKSSILFE